MPSGEQAAGRDWCLVLRGRGLPLLCSLRCEALSVDAGGATVPLAGVSLSAKQLVRERSMNNPRQLHHHRARSKH